MRPPPWACAGWHFPTPVGQRRRVGGRNGSAGSSEATAGAPASRDGSACSNASMGSTVAPTTGPTGSAGGSAGACSRRTWSPSPRRPQPGDPVHHHPATGDRPPPAPPRSNAPTLLVTRVLHQKLTLRSLYARAALGARAPLAGLGRQPSSPAAGRVRAA